MTITVVDAVAGEGRGFEVRGTIKSVMKQRPSETEQEGIDIDDPELLAALDAAMEEAERGEGTDGFEFLKQLREGTWRDPEVQ